MYEGYVHKWRRWLKSPLAQDPIGNLVFDYLLARAVPAPIKNKKYGYTLETGETDCTQQEIANDSKLSRDQVRSAFKRLKGYGSISVRTTPGKLPNITTITNYAEYNGKYGEKPNPPERAPSKSPPKTPIPVTGKSPVSPHSIPTLKTLKHLNKKEESSDQNQDTEEVAEWAQKLATLISQNAKRFNYTASDYQVTGWALELEQLSQHPTINNPSPERIAKVIKWGFNDEFWAPKLRRCPSVENFASMAAQIERSEPSTPLNGQTIAETVPHLDKSAQRESRRMFAMKSRELRQHQAEHVMVLTKEKMPREVWRRWFITGGQDPEDFTQEDKEWIDWFDNKCYEHRYDIPEFNAAGAGDLF